MAFLIIMDPHMAAIFGQFPANFRFSGALQRRRRTKRRWKSDKDRNGGVDVIGFIRSRTKRIIIRRQ